MARNLIEQYTWIPGVQQLYDEAPTGTKCNIREVMRSMVRELKYRFDNGNCRLPIIDTTRGLAPRLSCWLPNRSDLAHYSSPYVHGLFYTIILGLACKNAAEDYKTAARKATRFDCKLYNLQIFLQRYSMEDIKFLGSDTPGTYSKLWEEWLSKEPVGTTKLSGSPIDKYRAVLTPNVRSEVDDITHGRKLVEEAAKHMMWASHDSPTTSFTVESFIDNSVYEQTGYRSKKNCGTYRIIRKILGDPLEDKFLALLPAGTKAKLIEIVRGKHLDELILRDLAALADEPWVPEDEQD